jgi:ferredoxin
MLSGQGGAGVGAGDNRKEHQEMKVPNIDYSRCEGCGGCAEAFPQLFEMRGEKAWVINADRFDAVRDSDIMTICPYYAISIEDA